MFLGSHRWREICEEVRQTRRSMKDLTKNAPITTNATRLALDVKRVRKLMRTGVQGGGISAGDCDYCSIYGWGDPPPGPP
jgi:hypothetical protein